jgi:hypothetical protein
MEEELQAFLELIILNATSLKSNSICTHLDVMERPKI